MRAPLLCLGLLLAAAARAQAPYPPDLPPKDIAERAIREAPAALAAQSAVRAEEANRERLEAGPHEWAVRVTRQQRDVRAAPERRFNEWDVGLERPLRLPAKAAADRELGAQGVAQAQVAQGDAAHETARALLKSWFGWLREREALAQWREQTALLERQRAAIARRTELGDAARLELMLMDAALAQATASRDQARARADIAAAAFRRRFPQVPLPPSPQLALPVAVEGEAATWREELLAHNHELALAREQARRARLLASRAAADQRPDPTVGVRYAYERAGEERILGVTVAIPLPGQARRAGYDAALAQAGAAAHREADALSRIAAEAEATYIGALSAYDSWRSAQRAGERMQQAAALVDRAHALGEAGLSEVLTARRQANEAALAARLAQLEAQEARYRLLLDAHRLWATDAGD